MRESFNQPIERGKRLWVRNRFDKAMHVEIKNVDGTTIRFILIPGHSFVVTPESEHTPTITFLDISPDDLIGDPPE